MDFGRTVWDFFCIIFVHFMQKLGDVKKWIKPAGVAAGIMVAIGLVTVRPAKALFGEDILILGHIWHEQITTTAKVIATYNQLVKIYTTATEAYSLSRSMASGLENKDSMMSRAMRKLDNYTKSRYGETITWPEMINGRPELAPGAWATATVDMPRNPSWGGLGMPAIDRANLATFEAMDGSSTRCLQMLATYRRNKTTDDGALTSLISGIYDAGPKTRSVMKQLDLLTSANGRGLIEQQAQTDVQSCLAEQQTLQNKMARDEIVADFNSRIEVQRGFRDIADRSAGVEIQKISDLRIP